MKHFVEARTSAIKAIGHKDIVSRTEKVCLIIDLQGKCRVLAKASHGIKADIIRKKVTDIVKPAADAFWEDEIWVEESDPTPANRVLFETVWKQAKPEPIGQDRIFVLDRRLSKDAWFGISINPPWPLGVRTSPIVSFYSFKGGVGRTTALAALAINLARAGKKVVVIDFDLEAPGAGSILTPSAGVPAGLGVLDYLLEYPVASEGSLDIADFYHLCDNRAIIKDGEPIYVVPSGLLDNWYLEKLARVNYEYLYRTASENKAPHSPLHSLLKSLRAKLKPYIFLVDSRAGLHDLGGLSLSGIAHLQVLFGLRSQQSWDGLSLAISHLGKEMLLARQPQRTCAIVHAMASPQGSTREEEIRAFKEHSFGVFSENYYDASDAPNAEWPVPDPESKESPHFPTVITWDVRVAGYSSLADVAEFLCEGEHRTLSSFILEKLGKKL